MELSTEGFLLNRWLDNILNIVEAMSFVLSIIFIDKIHDFIEGLHRLEL